MANCNPCPAIGKQVKLPTWPLLDQGDDSVWLILEVNNKVPQVSWKTWGQTSKSFSLKTFSFGINFVITLQKDSNKLGCLVYKHKYLVVIMVQSIGTQISVLLVRVAYVLHQPHPRTVTKFQKSRLFGKEKQKTFVILMIQSIQFYSFLFGENNSHVQLHLDRKY